MFAGSKIINTATGIAPDLVLFDNGDQMTSITGGWYTSTGQPTVFTGYIGSQYIYMQSPLWSGGSFLTNNAIDTTKYLYIYYEFTTNGVAAGYNAQYFHNGYDGVSTSWTTIVNSSGVQKTSPILITLTTTNVAVIDWAHSSNAGNSIVYIYKIVLTNNPNYPN